MKTIHKKLTAYTKKHPRRAKAIPIVIIAIIGISTLLISQAATFSIALEPELASTKTGVTTPTGDSTASGNSYVQFGGAVTQPSMRPNETNTGVPAGTTLTSSSGTITVTTAGTVIDSINHTGCIVVKANNVTIKRSKITNTNCFNMITRESGSSLLIEDVEIDGAYKGDNNCIGWDGYVARRVNLHGCADGGKMNGNVTVEDSYIHDLLNQYSIQHGDGLQLTAGGNITIRNNVIDVSRGQGTSPSAAIMLGADEGALGSNFLFEGNYFNGGGFIFFGGYDTSNGTYPANMTMKNNRFGRSYTWGTHRDIHPSVVWTGNVWDDTGQTINR